MIHRIKLHVVAASVATAIILWAMSLWFNQADVIWFEKGQVVVRTPTRVVLSITGYKIRNCRYLNGEVGYVQLADGSWEQARFKYVDGHAQKPKATKRVDWYERQTFGLWEWKLTPGTDPVSVLISMGHDCTQATGPEGHRVTVIGPFDIKPST